jgi:hypothetical protein
MAASRGLTSRAIAGGVALMLCSCHATPRPASTVQECIEVSGFAKIAPGTAPDTQLTRTRALTDPQTGKPAGLAAIQVTVVSPAGRPVEGAQVNVPDTGRGRTGKDGRIEFHVLAPHEHHIFISAPGLLPQELALVSRVGFRDSVAVFMTTPDLGLPCDLRP